MSLYHNLLGTFRTQLGGNLARLKCLTDAVYTLTTCRSVNQVHMATHSRSAAKTDSHHRRLQRFFSEWKPATQADHAAHSTQNTQTQKGICFEYRPHELAVWTDPY